MELLGAKVHPVTTGTMTLKDAVNETMREWANRMDDTLYVLGSVMGPHPFPTIVRDFQKVISKEIKEQMLEKEGRLPDAVIACVGGGSNAIGAFYEFIPDKEVRLIGCEAAGLGVDTEKHAATIAKGTQGIFHGMKSLFCQNEYGQIAPVYSISAGLDYPGIGPEHAMQKAGADLIEIGIPFSDPIAEGPVIQEADERALAAGCTTDKLMDMVESIEDQLKIPVVFMTYMNPIFVYGTERFMKRAAECGICGVIVPDVPYEEKEDLAGACKKYGVELVSLIAPTSHERIQMIAKEAEGFLYCVSSLGVTGVRKEITTNIGGMIEKVREVTDIPCAVGFGISTPEQAKEMAAFSDGAIVGSAIVRIVAEHGTDCVPYVKEYVKKMKAAVAEA